VKLDVGVHIDGYIADTARTTEVSTRNWTEMIRAAEEAVSTAIELMKPGVSTLRVGAAIERTIKTHGFKPVMNLTGHLLRPYLLHGEKSIPNVGERHEAAVVEEGDSFAIEPFATNGRGAVDGRRTGNIYRIVHRRPTGDGPADGLVEAIHRDLKGLPFSERWAHRIDAKAPVLLQRLMRAGVVMTYPVLVEVGKGMVAQAEHSVVVGPDGAEAYTL
jgi:methionyl aminopeptidase